jgi:hypothetical protein
MKENFPLHGDVLIKTLAILPIKEEKDLIKSQKLKNDIFKI